MYRIINISDRHLRPTAVFDSETALRNSGCIVQSLLRNPIQDDGAPEDTLRGFDGSSTRSKFVVWRYIYYAFLYVNFKVRGIFSKQYFEYLNGYAQWHKLGRVVGVERALFWHRVWNKLRGWEPDLIHVHFVWNLRYALPLARALDIPVVCTVHGSDIYLNEGWHEILSDTAVSRILSVSSGLKTTIQQNSPDCAAKTAINFNPVNIAYLSNPKVPPGSFRIICVAAFRELKNHQWLLQALRVLKDQNFEFECVMVGEAVSWEPEQYTKIKTLTKCLGLEERVKFLGWLSTDEVMDEIDNSTVLTLTSTSEGLPSVVVEALARQRTPVVTDLSGTRDATCNGAYGYLVPLNDVDALAHSFLRAHEETLEQGDKVKRGREFVIKNFHPEVHASNLIEIYGEVISMSCNR